MAKILIDICVILDALFSRDKISEELIDRLVETENELFITASMVATLDYFLNKYNVNKGEFKKRFFERFKVIATTGFEAKNALDFPDGEDALIALSFKRIAEDGIVITKNREFPSLGLKIMSPEEALQKILGERENRAVPLLDLKKQYRSIQEELDNAILTELARSQYILGPQVERFERELAKYLGVKHCVGVASGTDALLLSLRALAIKRKGKEFWDKEDLIITTPFTFTATGDTILRAGATPLFVDIDLETYNIDPQKIRSLLSSSKLANRIVGIVPVHLYGMPCNMDEIMKIAKEYNLFVLEDTAQAFGARWNGKKVGTIGDVGAFSFFPSKNLGAFGDAGAVATDDEEIAELIRILRVHGGKDKYNVEYLGYKARLDTIQAAILLVKLKYIDELNEKRRVIAKIYNEQLEDVDLLKLPKNDNDKAYHVYHQYTVFVKDGKREKLQKYLKDKGIQTMVYYPVPLHKMKVFEGRCKVFGDLKFSEEAAKNVLSLPIEPLMSEEDLNYVIKTIREFK